MIWRMLVVGIACLHVPFGSLDSVSIAASGARCS